MHNIIVISQTRSWYLILKKNFSESTKSNVKCFKVESKMVAVNIQFPLIIIFVKHVLRNNHYRNTILVFAPEITVTLKVISATTRVILATNKLVSASDKVI